MSSVFLSYSHKDERWKELLKTHLGVLDPPGLLETWDDRQIGAGSDWFEKIQEAMGRARVAVLFISADFLTSKFVLEEEIPQLLQRRQEQGLTLLPVIVRSCAWHAVGWLRGIQTRPLDGKPLAGFRGDQREAQLATIASEIREMLQGPLNLPLGTKGAADGRRDGSASERRGEPDLAATGDEGRTVQEPPQDPDLATVVQGPRPHRRAERNCFVLMPLSDEFQEVYREAILPAVEGARGLYRCFKGDDSRHARNFTEKILRALLNADLVILVAADPLEWHHLNLCLMYGLGVAHSFRKPTIVVADRAIELPFALEAIRLEFSRYTDDRQRPAFLRELREQLQRSLNTPEILDEVGGRIPRNPVTTELSGTQIFIEDLPWLCDYREMLKQEREAQTVWEITRDLFWPSETLFFQSLKEGIRVGKKYYFMIPDDERVHTHLQAIKDELRKILRVGQIEQFFHFVAIDQKYFTLCPFTIVLYDANSATQRRGIICEPMASQVGNDPHEQDIRSLFSLYEKSGRGLDSYEHYLLNLDWLQSRREATFDIRLDRRVVDQLAVFFARLWNVQIREESRKTTSKLDGSPLLNGWLIGSY